jgi:CubicO group peptidase (beta-lactamase class C family)
MLLNEMKPGWRERFNSFIPEWMRASHTPGTAVTLLQPAVPPEHWCFGVTSQDGGQPITPHTVFQAASLSKPVFAYMAMKLCELEILELDKPLCDYLPEPLLTNEPRLSLITARRVLSHTTGLPNWSSEETPLALRFTPGERFGYSGEGYVYLQRVIERLTGQSLDAYMQAGWFQALGMPDSSFIWRESDEPRMAHAHKQGQPHAEYRFTEDLSAASLYTTPMDYARFASQVLFPPEVDTHHLSPHWLETILAPQVEAGPDISWGLGWGLANARGQKLAWQWGDNTGYKHMAVISPALKMGVIVLTNNEQGSQVWKNVLANSLDPHGLIFTCLESM